MIVVGTTMRITHASPHGGAVFRLRPDGNSASVRVKADFNVLRDAPGIGDRFSVAGVFEQGHYGRQLIATAVLPEPASNESVHILLLHNHAFAHIRKHAKQQLSERLGSQLLPALENRDVVSFINAGAKFSDAHELVAAWLEYSSTITTRRFLLDHGLSHQTASMASNLWGLDAIDSARRNPYCLLAVANWDEVDASATSAFGCTKDDKRRYLGFADAIFNEAASRGRAALFASEFEKFVSSRLGDSANSDAILAVCILARRLRVVQIGRHRYIQGATLARIEAQIQSCLNRLLTSTEDAPKALREHTHSSRDVGLRDRFLELLARSPIVVLNMPGAAAAATAELVRSITDELAIISPTLAFTSSPMNGVEVFRLSEFVGGRRPPDVSGKVVVVQEASMLDLLTARKLLRSVAGAVKLVLIGDRRMLPAFGPGHIFSRLAQSNAIPSIDAMEHLASPSLTTPLAGLPSIWTTSGGLRPVAEFVHHVPVESVQEFISVALKEYRIVFEQNPSEGIIIASTRDLATSLNETLHHEVLDYAMSQGGDSVTISLQSRQTAAVGDYVVYTSRDYSRGLFHGSRGLVTEIFPATKAKRRNPTAVAKIEFDTSGPLEVTPRDCQTMMLGHAVQAHHAAMSRWRKVIIAAAPSRNLDNSWVWRSATRAVEQLVIVELGHAFRDALSTEARDTTYVPLFDWNPL